MSCTQAELAVVVMMPEPLLVPFPEGSIEEDMVSSAVFGTHQKLTCLLQPQVSTSGVWICDQCLWHGLFCDWPELDSWSKSCTVCKDQKSVCTIQGDLVSKWKPQGKSEKAQAQTRKQAEVESEVELESEGSGGDGWRARGFQDLSFTLLGLQDREDE